MKDNKQTIKELKKIVKLQKAEYLLLENECNRIKKQNSMYTQMLECYKKGLPRFKIPSKIVLLGKTYKIKIVNKLPNSSANGSVNYRTKVILLSATSDDICRTFLHECNHIICRQYSLGNGNDELWCQVMADFQTQIFESLFLENKLK